MSEYRIYLAGAMSGTSYKEQTEWRQTFKNSILDLANKDLFDINPKVKIFNQCEYYNDYDKTHKTEHEIFEFDLYNLKRSDLVVANLNRQRSIGTSMEIAIARENRIPVIGLHENDDELHPWLSECCVRVCKSMDELVWYVVDYYLM